MGHVTWSRPFQEVFSVFLLSFFFDAKSLMSLNGSQPNLDTFTYDGYLKYLDRTTLGIYSHGLVAKKNVFGADFEFWPTISLHCNMISAIGKKCQYSLQRCPYSPHTFGELWQKTAEIGWRVFAYCPLNFRIWSTCQPYRTDVIQQTASKLWHVLCSDTSL